MAVNPNIKKKADDIRNKIYGKEVRESLASGLEAMSSDVVDNTDRQDNVENQFQDVNNRSEIAEIKSDKAEQTSEEAKNIAQIAENKSDSVQQQFNQVVIDGDSSVEAAQARVDEKGNPHSTLKERIDDGFNKTTAQLAQTVKEKTAVSKRRAIITIETDDGMLGDYTVLLPLLNAKGVNASMAIPPAKMDQSIRMSWEQMHELVDDYGWSVMSHTDTEVQLGTISLDEVERELRISKEKLELQGFKCEHLSYPNGSHSNEVMEIAKKYYKSSGTIINGVNTTPVMSQKLFRASLGRTLEQLKLEVDKAIENSGWFIIYTHGDELEAEPEMLQKLSDLIDYALFVGATFMNHDEAWEEVGNIVDIGVYGSTSLDNNLVLSKRGDGVINNLSLEPNVIVYDASKNPFNVDSVITDFELYKITYTQIDAQRATGFPENKAGMLMTNRMNQWDGYPFQEYHVFQENKVYRRVWIGYSVGWSDFQLVQAESPINSLTIDYFTAMSPITVFPQGRITVNQVTTQDGLPVNLNGTLITNNIVTWGGYPTQTFYVANGRGIYTRSWTTSGWSDFKKVVQSNNIEVSVDFGSVPAGQVVTKTVNVSGVTNEDNLICSPKFAISNNIIWSSQINSVDTVGIRLYNPTDTAINVGSRTFKIDIIFN